MFEKLQDLPLESYSKKFSASLVYGLLSSVAVNFFFQPGHIYSSGATGMAQILTTLSTSVLGVKIPVSLTLYAINLPLFFLAWRFLGRRFTIFTVLTVTLSSFMIHLLPETKLTPDPVINAVFGGAVNGVGIGYALRNGLSSGGLDIVSLSIRKKTGHSVGTISTIFNLGIMLVAGYLFGWQYALYTMMTIFVTGRVTDAIFTKQKKMQVMIVTKNPEGVISCIQEEMHRGVTIIHGAEGAYSHERQTVLITIITRFEISHLKEIMAYSDPNAFVSISENVKILGNFNEDL
ncbi:Uncharacterized membrane-anchored protein YitT, contains DUF161 and DUF2179 domains [Pilibacter termitis]|uniref:Uncharacterized membrane-anchored protein YitT, contains DUF161 and DUF2179 domains n=1 Tax=Pilibacter termitis TaxID=263852 RepID=A0A1T4QQ26_9ENTE|nr:YitT family protein [Pilibacter termitis]SKA05869.1 Uncharacterized membrane-anchored protein YitT, contains DUF161 and DUF2179 domains [Pilibacter termitis]